MSQTSLREVVKLSRCFVGLALLASFLSGGTTHASPAPRRGHAKISAPSQSQSATGSAAQAQVDPQVKKVLDKMTAAGVLHPTTIEEIKKSYSFYMTLQAPPEKVFRVADRQIPGPAGNLTIRIYTPRAGEKLPVLVFFHGGGFVAGSLETHDVPLRAVANRCDCIVVSVAYRLAPAYRYPAATDDSYAATAWVASHAQEFSGDPHRIAVGGDGSGGNLAAVVALMARDKGAPHLVYQVLIYPMTDATVMKSAWWTESPDPVISREAKNNVLSWYLPPTGRLEDPYVSPILAENLSGLPSALVLTDQDDPLRDEAEQYANRMSQAGVATKVIRYPNVIHGFFLLLGQLDAATDSVNQVANGLKQAFANAPQN
jgi:acetyl esterase